MNRPSPPQTDDIMKLLTINYESCMLGLERADCWSLKTRDHQVYLLVSGGEDHFWNFHILQVKDGVASSFQPEPFICETLALGPKVTMDPSGNFLAWETEKAGFQVCNLLTEETHRVKGPVPNKKEAGLTIDDCDSYIAHMMADREFLYTTSIHRITKYDPNSRYGDEIIRILVKRSKYNWATKTSTVVSTETLLGKTNELSLMDVDVVVNLEDGRIVAEHFDEPFCSIHLELPTVSENADYTYTSDTTTELHDLAFQNADGTTDTFQFVPNTLPVITKMYEYDGTLELHRM